MKNLQPHSVWAHFATLCAIPRPSLHEAALREHLIEWAQAHGITAVVDNAGNLILKKPGSPGCEAMPGVILQGHLDMVCQANAGTQHDFERDPIRAVVRDGWVVADDTTLGADNGIGVALALAALEEPNLTHPPLEVLLTVNEECGMDGARGLASGTLQGKTLINLDTEEWGHFYLGCAGGVDVEVRNSCKPVRGDPSTRPLVLSEVEGSGRTGEAMEDVPPDYAILRFEVSGLRGGHSGIDIHLGRGNAIKLLAEALRDLSAHSDVRLIEMKGGTARNAIPREAFAMCALPAAIAASIDEWVRHRHEAWRTRFAEADANVSFVAQLLPHAKGKVGMGVEQLGANASTPSLTLPDGTTSHSTRLPQDVSQVAGYLQGRGDGSGGSFHGSTGSPRTGLDADHKSVRPEPVEGSPRTDSYKAIANAERDRLLAFLDSAANGVARISEDFPGVTDTSSNLGVVALEQGAFRATFKVRSLHDARADALADKLVAYAAARGLKAWKDGAYPGWTPNPSSDLLELCQQVYTAQFGHPASLQVIHAGLECGLLAASHPHLDMISFGPDIRGAHAPGESVQVESVARCWQLLKAVLQALAQRNGMMQLGKALRAWGTSDFETVLKQEIAQNVSHLPLQQGLSTGNYVTADPITVMINSVAEMENIIRVKAGIFYQGVLGGCSCADDPTPTSETNEYCEVQLDIDKASAATSLVLVTG